jgi:hypothetical protein
VTHVPPRAALAKSHPLRNKRAMDSQAMQAGWISYAIFFVVIALVITLRVRRMSRHRPLKVEQLWIVPAIFALITGFLYWRFPPQGLTILWCLGALAIGALAGWQRGRMMQIIVDPKTHEISQKASVWAMLFLLAMILIRYAAREIIALGNATWHLDVMTVTDVMIAFALGLISAQRLEMYIRAKRLLETVRAA